MRLPHLSQKILKQPPRDLFFPVRGLLIIEPLLFVLFSFFLLLGFFFYHAVVTHNFSHLLGLTKAQKNCSSFLPSLSRVQGTLFLFLLLLEWVFPALPAHELIVEVYSDCESIFSESGTLFSSSG